MAVATQGSRVALVTWTVITSFLFVAATIVAVTFYVEADRVSKQADSTRARYSEIIAETAIQSADVEAAKAARQDETSGLNPSMTVIDVLLEQRRQLASMVGGVGSGDSRPALQAARDAIAQAAEKATPSVANLPSDNLVDVVKVLGSAVQARQTEVDNLKKELDDARAALKQKVDETGAQIAAMNEAMAGVRAEQAAAMQTAQTVTQTKDERITSLQQDAEGTLRQVQELRQQKQVETADLSRQLEAARRDLDRVSNRLNDIRLDVGVPMMRSPDGRVIRLPGDNIAFIDLGYGDQITPGLTFEVYDRIEGVPAPGADEAGGLPEGKASLEVIRVGATSSECRIVRRAAGTAMTEGDLIANVVYDRNVKYRFHVYGNFDLDRDGRFTAEEGRRDAEVVKRLITQWGGQVVDLINVDTDFVVLGREPIVPVLTASDRDDPIERARFDAAVAAARQYDEIKAQAIALRIPVLNQNRFLHMTGYFEQSAR